MLPRLSGRHSSQCATKLLSASGCAGPPQAPLPSHRVTQCRRLPCSVRCISSSRSRFGTSAKTTMSLQTDRQFVGEGPGQVFLQPVWHMLLVLIQGASSQDSEQQHASKCTHKLAHLLPTQLACPACGCRRARRSPSAAAAEAPGGSSCTPAGGRWWPGGCCRAAQRSAAGGGGYAVCTEAEHVGGWVLA